MQTKVIVFFIGVFALFTNGLAQEMPPAQVTTIKVTQQRLAPKIELKGNVVSLQDAVIGAEVAGQLIQIGMIGSVFQQGQSIAKINDEELTLQLGIESANLASLQADKVFKDNEVARFSSLAKNDNASANRLQQAIVERDMLNQDIVVAKLRIAAVKRGLEKSNVPAPFTGLLTQRHAQKGEFISIGQSIARVVDTDNIEVSVQTPLVYLPLLSPGDDLSVSSSRGMYTLQIRDIVAVGDQQTRTAEVRLTAKGTDLVVGESVSVFTPRSKAQTRIAIPRDALVIRGKQTFLYRAVDGKAEQVVVDVVFADGNLIAIDGDIQVNDKVIIRGAERLQPGSAVTEV